MQSALRIALLGLSCLGVLASPRPAQASEWRETVQNYMADKPDLILCLTYSITGSESLHEELIRRKLLNAEDTKTLSTKDFAAGMSECSFLAAARPPFRIVRYDDPVLAEALPDFRRAGPFDVVYFFNADPGWEGQAFFRNGILTKMLSAIVNDPQTPLRARHGG